MMKRHNLDKLFNPKSIAVIGASDRQDSVGRRVFNNLLKGKVAGTLYAVNPQHQTIQGLPAYASVIDLPEVVDLAVITTQAVTVPDIIRQCGKKGIKAVVIISAGFSETGAAGKAMEQSILQTAEEHGIRLIGPNCLGIMRPAIALNATFDNSEVLPGKIALVSQSGAIVAAILDWASPKQIGFSSIISLGNAVDLDFGEILDFLAHDPLTETILLYIEGIHHAQRFMNGLRAAACIKPVVVIKGGRHTQGSRAAHSHTGALVGDDAAFDAALRREGAVRVLTIKQLFSAADIFASGYRTKGNRLAIITNGGGAGVMAADRASELNIDLPTLDNKTIALLNTQLPASWSHQNPVDIIGDAPPTRYHDAITACTNDDNIDGILALLIPVAMTDPLKVAQQIVKDAKNSDKPILACWMGDKQVKSSWDWFAKHHIPCFDTPEEAVEAFSYLVDYNRNQKLLNLVTPAVLLQKKPDRQASQELITSALAEGRTLLTYTESKKLLTAFDITVTTTLEVKTADEAITAANQLTYPVAMKINSPDITHKLEAGGVQLGITNDAAVHTAFDLLIANAKKYLSSANILGVTVERMFNDANNRELFIGVKHDKVFGPVITFGAGGSYVEIMGDFSVELPPLDRVIAKQMIERTKISKALGKFRNLKPVNLELIIDVLLRVSAMVSELPQIQEIDINPLVANDREVVAVDARFVIT